MSLIDLNANLSDLVCIYLMQYGIKIDPHDPYPGSQYFSLTSEGGIDRIHGWNTSFDRPSNEMLLKISKADLDKFQLERRLGNLKREVGADGYAILEYLLGKNGHSFQSFFDRKPKQGWFFSS